MIQIEATSDIAKAYAAEDPPFAGSTATNDKIGYFNVRTVTGGYVVHVENPDGIDKEYVVTSKVKLIKLIKKILEE